MIAAGLATADEAIFDLDFHAVMHWGHDPALEKHYVPTRSQRARSVLTFFAQDSGTHNLVYANADIAKATQTREVIAFCDHWKAVIRQRPAHADHGPEGHHPAPCSANSTPAASSFLTLRMRSPALRPPHQRPDRQRLQDHHPGPARPAQPAESARGHRQSR